MIKIKLCLLLIVVIALIGCKGKNLNPVTDSSIQSKEDNEIKEPATENESEHSEQEQETNESNNYDPNNIGENQAKNLELEPVKDGFKRATVHPWLIKNGLNFDAVSHPEFDYKELDKSKIIIDVLDDWTQSDNDFLDSERRLEGFSTSRVTKDFIMDKNIQDLHHGGGLIHYDDPIVTSGITDKGYPYIQYAPGGIEEGDKVFYWDFVRVNDELIVEFHTLLDWDDREAITEILNSLVFIKEE